jgi:hypothetical protein
LTPNSSPAATRAPASANGIPIAAPAEIKISPSQRFPHTVVHQDSNVPDESDRGLPAAPHQADQAV